MNQFTASATRKPRSNSELPGSSTSNLAALAVAQSNDSILPSPKPPDASPEWKRLVGIYAFKHDPKIAFILFENEGKLFSHHGDGSTSEFIAILDVFPEETAGSQSSTKRT